MGAPRILIVDGDRDSRNVYRIMLEYHGYEVLEVEDGESALDVVRSARPAAVVTELSLPLLDGHTLLDRLKADPDTAAICIVVLTARALVEDRERALRAGCSAFLTKPFEPQELVHEIGRLIR